MSLSKTTVSNLNAMEQEKVIGGYEETGYTYCWCYTEHTPDCPAWSNVTCKPTDICI
jgi:hypothetical protein